MVRRDPNAQVPQVRVAQSLQGMQDARFLVMNGVRPYGRRDMYDQGIGLRMQRAGVVADPFPGRLAPGAPCAFLRLLAGRVERCADSGGKKRCQATGAPVLVGCHGALD